MEQVTVTCGKRKIHRAINNSVKAYNDLKMANLSESMTLLLPVLFEKANDFLGELEEDVRESLEGILLLGGREEISMGAQFDALRDIRQSRGDDFVIGVHENATPCKYTT